GAAQRGGLGAQHDLAATWAEGEEGAAWAAGRVRRGGAARDGGGGGRGGGDRDGDGDRGRRRRGGAEEEDPPRIPRRPAPAQEARGDDGRSRGERRRGPQDPRPGSGARAGRDARAGG